LLLLEIQANDARDAGSTSATMSVGRQRHTYGAKRVGLWPWPTTSIWNPSWEEFDGLDTEPYEDAYEIGLGAENRSDNEDDESCDEDMEDEDEEMEDEVMVKKYDEEGYDDQEEELDEGEGENEFESGVEAAGSSATTKRHGSPGTKASS
jgi:hypothetical protein